MSRTTGTVIPHELYPTPKYCVDLLLKYLRIEPTDWFLEPCAAEGAIYNHEALETNKKRWAELRRGRDYLTFDFKQKFDIIITNPPFSLTEKFLAKSKSELKEGGVIAYLQRLNYLGSDKRVPFWRAVGEPDMLGVITPRPRFVNHSSDSCEYGWFIWDDGARLGNPRCLFPKPIYVLEDRLCRPPKRQRSR